MSYWMQKSVSVDYRQHTTSNGLMMGRKKGKNNSRTPRELASKLDKRLGKASACV